MNRHAFLPTYKSRSQRCPSKYTKPTPWKGVAVCLYGKKRAGPSATRVSQAMYTYIYVHTILSYTVPKWARTPAWAFVYLQGARWLARSVWWGFSPVVRVPRAPQPHFTDSVRTGRVAYCCFSFRAFVSKVSVVILYRCRLTGFLFFFVLSSSDDEFLRVCFLINW